MNPRSLFLAALSAALVHLAAPAAMADVGVEKVSRTSGKPGESVQLTIGCGACASARGRAAAARGQGPVSLPVSLVPADEVPRPHRCGPNVLCPPRVRAVPRRPPFTFLGEALPPRGGGEADGPYPLYVLDFTIPRLPPGTYTYVIYCEFCLDGKGGSLVSDPTVSARWRLRLRR